MDKNQHYINPYKLFVGAFVPNWLLHRVDISLGAKLVYAKLCQYAGKNGECFPRQIAIAKDIGVGRRQILRYIDELIKNKLIESKKIGFQGKNFYRFLWHEWMQIDLPNVTDMSHLNQPNSDISVTPIVTYMSHPTILRESIKRINNTYSPFEEIWSRYPSKIGKSKALDKFKKTVKTEGDLKRIRQALEKYLAHLKANSWKQPQDGKTWFSNWQDWADYKEKEVKAPVDIKTLFEKALELCNLKLSGSVDKARVREVLAQVPEREQGTVYAFLDKRGLAYLVDEVIAEAKKNQHRLKSLFKR